MVVLVVVGFFVIVGGLMSNWTDSNLDFWLSYLKGSAVNSPFWVSIILIFVAPAVFLFNLISFLLRLALS